jgi:DNA invertase Pin-like site-specific DNA recombinase
MRFAFYGRVSTDDAQDPSLSIPRQLAACKGAIEPAGGDVVTHYWDVESGRKELDQRGKGNGAGLGVSVPREGGLADLLEVAANGRTFDAVIVESIDRLSRMTADATHIERQLEQRDIGLFAADEPMTANATAILTRRVKQGVAEWYVRDLVEKSRRGMEESVRQPVARSPTATGSRSIRTPTPTRRARARRSIASSPTRSEPRSWRRSSRTTACTGWGSVKSATSSTPTSSATRPPRNTPTGTAAASRPTARTVAADVAGHPRALQIKEEIILDELVEFMGRRLFGPERLRLLRDELARSVAENWR